jgi:hypothetical protein
MSSPTAVAPQLSGVTSSCTNVLSASNSSRIGTVTHLSVSIRHASPETRHRSGPGIRLRAMGYTWLQTWVTGPCPGPSYADAVSSSGPCPVTAVASALHRGGACVSTCSSVLTWVPSRCCPPGTGVAGQGPERPYPLSLIRGRRPRRAISSWSTRSAVRLGMVRAAGTRSVRGTAYPTTSRNPSWAREAVWSPRASRTRIA